MDITGSLKVEKMKINNLRQNKKLITLLIILVIVVFNICTYLTCSVFAKEEFDLKYLIEQAVSNNPDYQITKKEYRLDLKEHDIKINSGFKESNINLMAVNTKKNGPVEVRLNYSGELPYKIKWNGYNSLYRGHDGNIKLDGNIGLSLNLNELLEEENIQEKINLLNAANSLYMARNQLINEVVNNYYSIYINKLQTYINKLRLDIVNTKLSHARIKLDKGYISKEDYKEIAKELNDLKQEKENLLKQSKQNLKKLEYLIGLDNINDQLVIPVETLIPVKDDFKIKKVDQILRKNNKEYKKIIEMTYEYKNALLNKKKAEQNLNEIKQESEWDLNVSLSAEYKYGNIYDETTDLSGTISLVKDLYSPQKDLAQKRVELQLEKTNLSLEKAKRNLLIIIEERKEQINKSIESYNEAMENYNKTKNIYQQAKMKNRLGYISDLGLKEKELELFLQRKNIIITKKELLLNKIGFAEIFSIEI